MSFMLIFEIVYLALLTLVTGLWWVLGFCIYAIVVGLGIWRPQTMRQEMTRDQLEAHLAAEAEDEGAEEYTSEEIDEIYARMERASRRS